MQEPRPVPKEWLTMKEAAAYMSVSVAAIRRWLKQGFLNRYQPPDGARRMVRVKKSELDEFMVRTPYKRFKPYGMAVRFRSQFEDSGNEVKDTGL